MGERGGVGTGRGGEEETEFGDGYKLLETHVSTRHVLGRRPGEIMWCVAQHEQNVSDTMSDMIKNSIENCKGTADQMQLDQRVPNSTEYFAKTNGQRDTMEGNP